MRQRTQQLQRLLPLLWQRTTLQKRWQRRLLRKPLRLLRNWPLLQLLLLRQRPRHSVMSQLRLLSRPRQRGMLRLTTLRRPLPLRLPQRQLPQLLHKLKQTPKRLRLPPKRRKLQRKLSATRLTRLATRHLLRRQLPKLRAMLH